MNLNPLCFLEFQGRHLNPDTERKCQGKYPRSGGPLSEEEDPHTAKQGSKPVTEQPRESMSGKTMPTTRARTPSAKKCGSSSTIEDCLEQFIRPEVIRGEHSLCQVCDLMARRIGRYCTGCCLETNFARGKFTLLFFAPSLALPRFNLLLESTLPCAC